jgi:uncharacterized protein (TIGR00269 family)
LEDALREAAGSCFICRRKGRVFDLRDFGSRVCPDCLPEFVKRRVLSTIRSHHMISSGDVVAVGVSGGKDSAALLHILNQTARKLDIKVMPFHLNLGFGDFSERAQEAASNAAEISGLELNVFYISDYEVRVEPIGSFPACAVCGALKRSIFNRIARKLGANVLATAHTFDDIFLFAVKNLVSGKDNIPRSVLQPEAGRLPRKIKPLYRIPEYLTSAYCMEIGIKHITGECPVSDGRGHALKKILAEIDTASPGFRRQVLDALKRVYKNTGKPPKKPQFSCIRCGEPSTQEICPVCRVREYQLKNADKLR